MTPDTAHPGLSVRLTRRIAAPPEQVFRAWTDPEALQQWFGPHGYETREAEIDLRVGGVRSIVMVKPPDGKLIRNTGIHREVAPPRRLVFTWRWDDPAMDDTESLVTVELSERDGGTELVLTHEKLPTVEERDGHREGWKGCIERLQSFL